MEIIVRGRMFWIITSMVMLMSCVTVAEGELSTLAWLPGILAMALTYGYGPEPLPPEPDPYISKQHQVNGVNWFMKNIISLVCKDAWKVMTSRSSMGGVPGGHKCGYRYLSHQPCKARVWKRHKSRMLAMSLRLVTITCMAATAMGDSTLCDLDSKQIAIDNCLLW
jgi:hypothetical protein